MGSSAGETEREEEVSRRLAVALAQKKITANKEAALARNVPQEVAEPLPVSPQEVGNDVENQVIDVPGTPDGDDGYYSSGSTRRTRASWNVTGKLFQVTNQLIRYPPLKFPRPPVAQAPMENGVPFEQFKLPQKLTKLKESSI
eukprot:augustus_masked-scaffold_27-processed-gene-4.68-mRNA-1 protein AED:1.00 eAED:1.00 QI:0/-1/0/0/-1/1/1/0/142